MTNSTHGHSNGLHRMPIQERIDWVIHRAHSQSLDFMEPSSWLGRNSYIMNHPTPIVAFMCMDGRVNVSLLTKMSRGIIRPFRNLGGRFDIGWPHLGDVFSWSVVDEARKGRTTLCLVTYHYSKSDRLRGCAGFHYDTDAARAYAFDIVRQLDECFGGKHRSVFPLVVGVETDAEALVLHGINDTTLDLSTISTPAEQSLTSAVAKLYPDMSEELAMDLLPLVNGNLSHIDDIKRVGQSSNLDHREWMICIGHGFDWLQMSNLALIIGPYSPDLGEPICKAASIVEENMRAGRVPDDGFLVLSEASYRELHVDRVRAERESAFLAKFATDVIRSNFPALVQKMHVRTAVMDSRSRGVDIITHHAV